VELTNRYSNITRTGFDLEERLLFFQQMLERAQTGAPRRPAVPVRKQNHLPAGQRRQLLADYVDGASVKEIARHYRVDRKTVMAIAKRAGLSPRHPKLTVAEVDRAVAMYVEGKALAIIGQAFGVKGNTIRKAIAERGVVIRSAGRNNGE
jgi:transposase-like protein